jgi:hypothetical protein
LLYAGGALLAGHIAVRHQMPGVAIVVLVAIAVATGILGKTLLGGVLRFTSMRRSSANVIARRAGMDEPTVWLVAHTDSKSQTIPMLVRVGSILATAIFFSFQLAELAVQWARLPISTAFQVSPQVTAVLTALAILPIVLCFITNRSPGALDNASGVAAVILAADSIRREKNVGVLLTSAEELGLAGARAFVASRAGKGIAINCDTIDNEGGFIAMRHGARESSLSVLRRVASNLGVQVRVRPLIRGVLADSVAFSDAGWDSWTLSRGNIGTLALVHTSKDRPERIEGAGIAAAARILAATAEELA